MSRVAAATEGDRRRAWPAAGTLSWQPSLPSPHATHPAARPAPFSSVGDTWVTVPGGGFSLWARPVPDKVSNPGASQGKIRSLEQIYLFSLPIKEHQSALLDPCLCAGCSAPPVSEL